MPHILYIHTIVEWGGGSGALCARIYDILCILTTYTVLCSFDPQTSANDGRNHYYLLDDLFFSFLFFFIKTFNIVRHSSTFIVFINFYSFIKFYL